MMTIGFIVFPSSKISRPSSARRANPDRRGRRKKERPLAPSRLDLWMSPLSDRGLGPSCYFFVSFCLAGLFILITV
jgi:hypothetical protein